MAAIDKTYLTRWEDYKQLKEWLIQVGQVIDDFGNKFRPLDFFWGELTEEKFNERIQKQLERVKKMYSEGGFEWYLKEGLMTQEEYDNFVPFDHINRIPIWNTPRYFDVWLIRNCPFDFIQDRLKEQYGGGWSKEAFSHSEEENMYIQIKNKTSCYDTYQRNGLGKNIRINKNLFPVFRSRSTLKTWTWIDVRFPDDKYPNYDENRDYWRSHNDLRGDIGRSYFYYKRFMKPKTLFRKLQKWDLPEGSIVHVELMCKYTPKGPLFSNEFDLIIRKR